MKRVISALLACLLLCGLAACGTTSQQPTETQAFTEDSEPVYTTQVIDAIIDTDFDTEALFKRLEGVWDDEYEFPGFMSFNYKDDKPSLYSGVYDGESNGYGALIGGRENANEAMATLYFQYPAVDDWPGPFPERTEELQIDLLDIDAGKLRVQHKTIWGTRDWHAYTYGGRTMQEAGAVAFKAREASAALQWNEALLAELGMTYEELSAKYGPRAGQDGAAIRFANGPGSYSFANWEEQPAPADRCVYIVVPAKTLFSGLDGPVAKEDFLAALNIRDGEGYGPVLKDGYNHHTLMHFGYHDRYQLSIWHNEKNAFQADDLAGVLDPQIN